MEVISGRFKGRRIHTPRGRKVKPTSSVVRRAIFDSLPGVIANQKVLDLYAGTGALGIEALSRGARKAVFVEKDPLCVSVIKKNISQLKDVETEVIPLDVFMALRFLKPEKFDFIFMDPPYKGKLVKSTLMELLECGIVKSNSWIVVEHHKKEVIEGRSGHFILVKQKKYGETVVSILRKLRDKR